MTKIELIFVGKNKFQGIRELEKKYEEKIKRLASFRIVELKESTKKDEKKRVKDESLEIIKATKNRVRILFDERGKLLSTKEFSEIIEHLYGMNRGVSLIVGGFGGVDNDLRKMADFKISLSKMTFSTYIARIVVLEQIFRAFTIIKNIKYHR